MVMRGKYNLDMSSIFHEINVTTNISVSDSYFA